MTEVEATDHLILEAAREVFLKKGFAGARMEDIAKTAGMNRALLHYYFRSKRELFQIVFDKHFTELQSGLQDILSSEVILTEKIQLIINFYLDKLEANPDLPAFIIQELTVNPERLFLLIKEKQRLPGRTRLVFEEQVREAVRKGRIREIDSRHLIINILSLVVFPYIGRPYAKMFLELDEPSYNAFLKIRRREISSFILKSIQP
ncbi:MAG: helix-turn-helix transcriptional regulator [Bacteroidetes bacterium]|nr:helix-turn-helix transcriptional regulator [Bacteroidota bacterium]